MTTSLVVAGVVTVGLASGAMSSLAGVGGAVVSTPGIRALGASPTHAIGSTVPAIIPGTLTGAWRYHREGFVQWRVALWCGITGAVSAVGGAAASVLAGGHAVMLITATVVIWSSLTVLRGPDRDDTDQPPAPPPTRRAMTAVGLAAGFIAGFLGAGGGVLMVPAFHRMFRLTVRESVASSLVAVALMSVTSLTSHVIAGHVNWVYAAALTAGVVPGARLGSWLSVRASDQLARRYCGGLLAALGVASFVAEVIALR